MDALQITALGTCVRQSIVAGQIPGGVEECEKDQGLSK